MKNIILALALFSVLLPVAGCDQDAATPTANDERVVTPGVLAKPPTPPLGGDDCKAPTFTATPPSILDALSYEVFPGTITPAAGGWLYVEPSSWPRGSSFSVMVPPGAVPGDPGELIEFELQIPTYQSYMDHQDQNGGLGLPAIMRLEPSHINFLQPIVVMGTYMPWTTVSLDPADHTTWAPSCEDDGIEWLYDAQASKWRFRFEAPHFSDWEIQDPPE